MIKRGLRSLFGRLARAFRREELAELIIGDRINERGEDGGGSSSDAILQRRKR